LFLGAPAEKGRGKRLNAEGPEFAEDAERRKGKEPV
jgi:hypothetical protein